MTGEDRKRWKEFRDGMTNTVSKDEVTMISELHAKYFNHRYKRICTCSPKTVQKWVNDLNELYLLTAPKRGRKPKQ